MSNIDPEVQAHIDAQAAFQRQRERERLGINSAAEAGVFDTSEPPELKLVRERDAWMAEQFDRANRPQDFTAIPIMHEDGPEHSGPATTPRVMAADWDAPISEDLGGSAPAGVVMQDVPIPAPAEQSPAPATSVDVSAEMARPAMLRGVMVDPASIGINKTEEPTA